MKIAAAYIRVSTEEQTELSPESQIKEIKRYANQNDMILPEKFIFFDEGMSGKNTKNRSGFNHMILTAKQIPKPFDVILLWKFSRFARNREDSIVYKSMLRKQLGIDVISITENLGDDKTSILIEALIEAMDEYYSVNLAEEVQRGMNEAIARGKPISSAPFGYQMKDGNFIPNPQTAPIVQMIFELYCAGETLTDIAETLNSYQIKTIRGNAFTKRSIRYILSNPTYIGKLPYRNDTDKIRKTAVNGIHNPLVAQSLFEQTQQLLKIRDPFCAKHYTFTNHKSLFDGLLRCGNCGGLLSYIPSNHGYQCCNYARGDCLISHYISEKKVTEIIINHLEDLFSSIKFSFHPSLTNDTKNQLQLAARQLKRLNDVLTHAKNAYLNNIDSLEEYQITKKQTQNQILYWGKKIKDLNQTSPSSNDYKQFITFSDLFNTINSKQTINTILKTFIHKITYNSKTQTFIIDYFFDSNCN